MVFGDGSNVQASSTCTITDSEGNVVTLAVKSLGMGMDKQLMIFPIPQKGSDDTKTWLIDLQRCKEAVSITGFIVDESTWTIIAGNQGLKTPPAEGSTGTPLAQKKVLVDMMRKQNEDMTLRWGADVGGSGSDSTNYETIQGSIQKVDIKEMPGTLLGYNPNFVDNSGTWVCSDTQYKTKGTCEQNGETWSLVGAANQFKAWHLFYQITFVFVRGEIKN